MDKYTRYYVFLGVGSSVTVDAISLEIDDNCGTAYFYYDNYHVCAFPLSAIQSIKKGLESGMFFYTEIYRNPYFKAG